MNKQLLFALAGIALFAATAYFMTSTSSIKESTEASDAYKMWKKNFNIKQSSSEEDMYRESIFAENYYQIKEHNANPTSTYKMGLNAFSALTQEEFRLFYLNNNVQTSKPSQVFAPKVSSVASSINWANNGVLPPVKNQGQCGSCWAFSTVAVLESTNVIYNNSTLVSLSEQTLVDCVPESLNCDGCDGGWPYEAALWTQSNGIAAESAYPYTALDGTCQNFSIAYQNKGSSAVSNTVVAFQEALQVQPISICVDAAHWSPYSSGVFNNCSSKANKADHAVVVVGYNENNQWIVRNSWGTSWGNAGYITLASGNTCGILNYGVVAN